MNSLATLAEIWAIHKDGSQIIPKISINSSMTAPRTNSLHSLVFSRRRTRTPYKALKNCSLILIIQQPQSKTETEKAKLWEEMETEVKFFLNHLDELNIKPLVVKTCKGFHVYIFLDSVYGIEGQIKLLKEVYKQLQIVLLEGHEYKYIDWHVVGDLNRLSRIPLSLHQKTGQECIIVDNQLRPDKIRSLSFSGCMD